METQKLYLADFLNSVDKLRQSNTISHSLNKKGRHFYQQLFPLVGPLSTLLY